MFRQSGAALEVTESGLALPLYTAFTVAYGLTTQTYTFRYHGTIVATVTLTYTDDTYATLTAGTITTP